MYLKQTKLQIVRLIHHPKSFFYLIILCFLDAFILPITPIVMLLPMALLLQKRQLIRIIAYASLASLLGAILGYLIGYMGQSKIIQWCDYFGYKPYFEKANVWMQCKSFWAMLAIGLSPLPFKIFNIYAGIMQIPFGKFMLVAFLSRSLKFSILTLGSIYVQNFGFIYKRKMKAKYFYICLILALLVYLGCQWID